MPAWPPFIRKADKVGEPHLYPKATAPPHSARSYGGATVCAWYPITAGRRRWQDAFGQPFARSLRPTDPGKPARRKYAIVQGEGRTGLDRGIVIGRVMERPRPRLHPRTSGPGISLMDRVFIGLSYSPRFPGRDHGTCSAAGPRPACRTRTPAMRPSLPAAYAFAWRHQACAAVSGKDRAEALRNSAAPPSILPSGCRPRSSSMLDLGYRHEFTGCGRPLRWDPTRDNTTAGKVMTAEMLRRRPRLSGRYLDVDGGRHPYRTYPGTPPTKGSFFHPRHLGATVYAPRLFRGGLRFTATTCSGLGAAVNGRARVPAGERTSPWWGGYRDRCDKGMPSAVDVEISGPKVRRRRRAFRLSSTLPRSYCRESSQRQRPGQQAGDSCRISRFKHDEDRGSAAARQDRRRWRRIRRAFGRVFRKTAGTCLWCRHAKA